MSDQAFRNPCLSCNVDKPKPLQAISRDGTQAFKRDSSGAIISRSLGGVIGLGHGGAPGTIFGGREVELQLQDGTWIKAFEATGQSTLDRGATWTDDHRFETDCHGVSFTQGQYWINDDQVAAILSGGGFTEAATPKPGDIGVYRNASGDPVHSVTVTKVDPTTGDVLEVSGLGGLEMHEHINTPADGWSDPNATIKYYTK